MKTFNYTQSSASNSWTVQHNLGSVFVSVDVTVPHDAHPNEGILPYNVTIQDSGTVIIQFTYSTVGTARIVAS